MTRFASAVFIWRKMPFSVSSDESGGFWVTNANTGRRMSKKPFRTRKLALRYQRALEANAMPNEKKHGAVHTAAEQDKVQAIHNHAVGLGAECSMPEKSLPPRALKDMKDMGGEAYARQEAWDIQSAANAMVLIASMAANEVDEPDNLAEVGKILKELVAFIDGEIDEMLAANSEEDYEEEPMKKVPAVLKEEEYQPIDLSYAKSLGLSVRARDLAVKYVGRDEIKGYTFLWGNPSITDVEREFFTKSTDFWDGQLGKNPRPLTWDHGQDEEFKAAPVIGQILDFGDDDLGRWYTAKMDRSHKYRKMIDKLIEQGVLGTSSDSAPQYVIRERQGKSTWLKQWPWFASALTDVPCEPRMIDSIEFLKSLGITLPDAPVAWEWDAARLELLKYQP